MITYTTPTGSSTANSTEEALDICQKQATEEALRTTGICSTLSYKETTTIICNKKKWVVSSKDLQIF